MENTDLIPAYFCSGSIRDAQKIGFQKAKVYSAAGSAGIITQSEADAGRLKHELAGARAIGATYLNYGPDALRRGSARDQTGLEKIIGPDTSSDLNEAHEIVSEMAASRVKGHL